MYKLIAAAKSQPDTRRCSGRTTRPLRRPTRIRPQPPRRRRTPPPLRTTRHSPARPQTHPGRTPQPHRQHQHRPATHHAQTSSTTQGRSKNLRRDAPPEIRRTPLRSRRRQRPPIDPGTLMRLVSRNTKRGAQFTPQGILRWPLTSAKAEDVLTETRSPPRRPRPKSHSLDDGANQHPITFDPWPFSEELPVISARMQSAFYSATAIALLLAVLFCWLQPEDREVALPLVLFLAVASLVSALSFGANPALLQKDDCCEFAKTREFHLPSNHQQTVPA